MVFSLLDTRRSLPYSQEVNGMAKHNASNPPQMRSPREWGMPFEDVWLTGADGVRIHSWFITQKGADKATAPTLVYFHGNAGNIGVRLPMLADLWKRCGVNVLAVDYRGYGDSAGSPNVSARRPAPLARRKPTRPLLPCSAHPAEPASRRSSHWRSQACADLRGAGDGPSAGRFGGPAAPRVAHRH